MNLDTNYKKINEFQSSYSKSFLYSFFIENEILRIKNFWKINEKDELIDFNFDFENHKKKEIPDISVIITTYNQANCFYRALRSVQNQSLKNIEIIIVDDSSTDISLKILENYQNKDTRIVILKHLHNYGKIKSRSDGVKLAKGKFITIIDGDDGLAKRDILYNSFNIAQISNLDIVEFNHVNFVNKHYRNIETNLALIENLNNRIIYQPELKFKFIIIRNEMKYWSFVNRQIWAKLIRNEIFKKAIEFIGTKYTEDFISIFEDTIMSITLFIISNSYYLLREPGYYRTIGECLENNYIKDEKFNYDHVILNKEIDSIKYINFLIEKLNRSRTEVELIYHEFFTISNQFDLCKNYKYNNIDKLLKILVFKFNIYNKEHKRRIIEYKKKCIEKII